MLMRLHGCVAFLTFPQVALCVLSTHTHICIFIYLRKIIYATQIKEEKTISLIESKGWSIRGAGGRKEKWER